MAVKLVGPGGLAGSTAAARMADVGSGGSSAGSATIVDNGDGTLSAVTGATALSGTRIGQTNPFQAGEQGLWIQTDASDVPIGLWQVD